MDQGYRGPVIDLCAALAGTLAARSRHATGPGSKSSELLYVIQMSHRSDL